VVAESEHCVALRDIDPQAPTHLIVVTREPHPDVTALALRDPAALVDLHRLAARVAEQAGLTAADQGWRLVFNSGPRAGQSVPHVHGHVLGGRDLGWPPGWPARLARPADRPRSVIATSLGGTTRNDRHSPTTTYRPTPTDERPARSAGPPMTTTPHPTGSPSTTSPSRAGSASTSGGSSQTTIVVPASIPMVSLLGSRDELLRVVETAFPADVHVRGNQITVTGRAEEVALVERLFDQLVTVLRTGQALSVDAVQRSAKMMRDGAATSPADVLTQNVLSHRGRTIRAKTLNQKRYVDAIDRNTLTFGIGPAGTGKTYLAVAKAVQALQGKKVNRIVLTRPAVEAGERLGFLPGTLSEKIDPYLRPLYDSLRDMVDPDAIARLMTSGVIEVAPLAYMRGRTLNDAFIILDEAQNTTPEQMKMFLTRLGFGSKIVVTGDVTQVDLPHGAASGLRTVTRIVDGLPDVHVATLTTADVVRHSLVGHIVDAYERWDARDDQ